MDTNTFHVLILGTDNRLTESVAQAVRIDGGRSSVTASCADAQQYFQSHPVDLVFLDFKSAEVESLNLLRQIKHHPPARPVLTIGLATPCENTAVLRAFDQGLDQVIQIPFETGIFKAQIRGAMHQKRQTESAMRRQQELTDACRAAEASCRAKSDFLASMSHEIRTPMSGVIAMADLMKHTPLSQEQRSYLDTILGSGESLLTIINDILDFSKIEAGKMEMEKRPFSLRHCIEESLDLLAVRSHEKGLDLGYEAADSLPEFVIGDAERLRQVLVNLVGNAVKFTNQGDVFVSVHAIPHLHAGEQDRLALRLHFTVRDSGIGIPADKLARLFRAFTQADASTARKYGGSGLGLAISRKLVELMGGRMWAESVQGKGSTFHFTINVTAQPDSSPPRHTLKQAGLSGRKILILDDNTSTRKALTEQCRRWGMIPESTDSPAKAIQLLASGGAFDIALIDLHMPEMDGLTVASEMQNIPSAALLPVVLLTPLGKAASNLEDGSALCAHTVNKPVKPAQLCATLENALLNPKPASSIIEPPQPHQLLAEKLPLNILVVEDEPINQSVARRQLQKLGYQPVIASNGREALNVLDQTTIDLIFMDHLMPEMNGIEATHEIRRRQQNGLYPPSMIIVALTASAMPGDREKFIAAGMDDCLIKPVREKDLCNMIEHWSAKATGGKTAPQDATGGSTRTEPPVDMSRMADISDGNADSLRELVDMYLKQTKKQIAELDVAIQSNNIELVRRVAHSCAGASVTLGMTRIGRQMRELEHFGVSGTLDGAADKHIEVTAEFKAIQDFLKTQPELTAVVNAFTQS